MHPALLYYWYRTPLLRPVIGLAAGILFQWYKPLPIFFIAAVAVAGLALWLLLYWAAVPLRRWVTALSLLSSGLLFFAAGSWRCIKADVRHHPQWLGATIENNFNVNTGDRTKAAITWEYVLDEAPAEKKQSLSLVATVLAQYQNTLRTPCYGKILMVLAKDKQAALLRAGDTLRSARLPLAITPPANPGQRNWQQVQLMKGITHRLFLKTGDYHIMPDTTSFIVQRALVVLQKKILRILQRYIPDTAAAALAQALLIGYRQDLDPALSRSYSNTGTIHIIAISGMHLALIGGLLSWGLRPLDRWRLLKQVTQLLVLGILWLFSLLAGGAPSLLRATLLFSSVAFGEIMHRRGNSLNTLMAAAFLLLCYDPFWLWDLGFQLSFAAVAGILLVGRYLARKLSHTKIWWHAPGQLIAISIAAQLFTTPLSLFHFHQFPGAFLLGNLLAVPISNLVLTALLLLVIVSPFSLPATLIGKAISFLIQIMNGFITWLERIPGLLLTDLQWELPETILLMVLLLAAAHWVINKSHGGRLLTLLSGLALVYCQATLKLRNQQQRHIIVYHLPGATAIDWIAGTTCYSFIDSGSTKDPGRLQYTLQQARQHYGVRYVTSLPIGQQLRLGENKIWLADKQRTPPTPDSTLIDLLVVNQRSPFRGETWVHHRTIKTVIIDASVGTRTRTQWLALLDSMGLTVHDTQTEGAFVSSFR